MATAANQKPRSRARRRSEGGSPRARRPAPERAAQILAAARDVFSERGYENASMAEIAGSAWTPEYAQAWSEAFGIVAAAMLEGAERAQLEAAA